MKKEENNFLDFIVYIFTPDLLMGATFLMTLCVASIISDLSKAQSIKDTETTISQISYPSLVELEAMMYYGIEEEKLIDQKDSHKNQGQKIKHIEDNSKFKNINE